MGVARHNGATGAASARVIAAPWKKHIGLAGDFRGKLFGCRGLSTDCLVKGQPAVEHRAG
jgi:hypothetical protein